MKPPDAVLDPVPVEVAVAGNDPAVRELHDDRRVVAAAIEVDHEPRPAREQRGRGREIGQGPGQLGRADVVGDVAREIRRPKAPADRVPRGTAFDAWSQRNSSRAGALLVVGLVG